MRRRARQDRLVRVLWANAAAVALLGVALLVRSGGSGPNLLPEARAQIPVSGGAGLYVMPAQFATNIWGALLLDVDRQTLMAYQFDAAGKKLNFLAARDVTNDRRLGAYNTVPDPLEIKSIADKQQQTGRLPDAPPAGGAGQTSPESP